MNLLDDIRDECSRIGNAEKDFRSLSHVEGGGNAVAESVHDTIGGPAMTCRNFFLAFLFLLAPLAQALAAELERLGVDTPDGPRSYLFARPSQPSLGPRPLVILLHGNGSSASNVLGQRAVASPLAAWLPIVDREGLYLAALDGVKGDEGRQGWNDCRDDLTSNLKVDDVAFVSKVVQATQGVDPRRVYAMGMSNGGMMVLRLALELEPPPAAVSAVAASMASDTRCRNAARPVSVQFIAGTADPLVPYQGGRVGFSGLPRGTVLSVEQAVDYWRQANGLGSAPSLIEEFPVRSGRSNGTRASRVVYGQHPQGAQVELIRVLGGGHIEPSLTRHYGDYYERLVGPQNRDLESAEEAWRFFRDKRAPAMPADR